MTTRDIGPVAPDRPWNSLPRTNPACPVGVERAHQSSKAYDRGCTCPESAVARDSVLKTRAAQKRAKRAKAVVQRTPSIARATRSGQRPSDPDCPRDPDRPHQTANAHDEGCRCPEAVMAATKQRERKNARQREKMRGVENEPVVLDNVQAPPLLLPLSPVVRSATPVEKAISQSADLACRETDPELFFSVDPAATALAKRICRRCPSVDDCLTVALSRGEAYGVYGGMTPGERRTFRASMFVRGAA